ncbi:MAG: hypothetical protein K2Y29_14630 [Beijerinckiaceae bacterium]|nr:hypothetical protein [Beijerinckiaceae bacterium]
MDDPDAEKFPLSLKTAVRKARVEQAERSDVVNELRRAELARLEMLYDAFKPILAQVPANVDLFDAGVVGGERPRLFIDMIAFVEMAHDRRTYMFVQETRNGRVTLAESDKLDPVVEAMTDYIARRLVEREAALAADLTSRYALKEAAGAARPAKAGMPVAKAALPAGKDARPRWRRRAETALLFTIEIIGAIVLFVLLLGAVYFAWRFGANWWVAQYAQLR